MNYGLYSFYLGLCNFKTSDYRSSAIAFGIAIDQLKERCPRMIGYGYLARGNAALMSSIGYPQVQQLVMIAYKNAADAKLSGGYGGLAIMYSLNNDREKALQNLNKMTEIDKSPQSQSIVLFCSLLIADKDLFVTCLKSMDANQLKEIPFALGNIATGLEQFNLDKGESGYSKEDLTGDLLRHDQKQKSYGIIERPLDARKSFLELNRQERILIPRIDIEYSIGWGPQKCEAVSNAVESDDKMQFNMQESILLVYGNIAALRKKARRGDVDAQYNLGLAHTLGDGVAKSKTEAAKWFRKAAGQGKPAAQFNLGIAYQKGDGLPKDAAEAAKWFLKAAEQGFVEAQYNMGVMYADGTGVGRDLVESTKWLRKAAEQGHVNAQHNLGSAYILGNGVIKSPDEAAKWWLKAAEQGHGIAQYNLGILYADGLGVDKNLAEAIRWYRMAAEQGNADAQHALGYAYSLGEGVTKNPVEAVKWLHLAAEQEHAEAQYSLGLSYYFGVGVDKDMIEGWRWISKAAAHGHATAREILKRIREKYSDAMRNNPQANQSTGEAVMPEQTK